jgi:hypothetical protein
LQRWWAGLASKSLLADEILILLRLQDGSVFGRRAVRSGPFTERSPESNSKQGLKLVATFVPHASSNGGTR